jgi:hypothetical protein
MPAGPFPAPAGPDADRKFRLAAAIVGAASLAWIFRHFWLSGFDIISGDIGDARIAMVLMDQWRAAVAGALPWRSPPFFHPVPGVLGYTEAFFLLALPYNLVRLLGGDPYSAYELALLAARAAGFAGMALVLRRVLGLPRWAALFGGALFVLQNVYYVRLSHAQFAVFNVVPWAVLLGHSVLAAGPAGRWRRALSGLALGGLIGSMLLTSFTSSWYSGVAAILAIAAAVPVLLVLLGPVAALRGLGAVLARAWPGLLASVLALAALLVVFFRLYLPQLQTFVEMKLDSVLPSLPTPAQLLLVGPGNAAWGWLSMRIEPTGAIEQVTGSTPLLALAALFALGLGAFGRSLPRSWRAACWIVGLTALGWCFCVVRIGDFAAWSWIYTHVPGAVGLRALGRTLLVLPLLTVPLAAIAIAWIGGRGRYGRQLAIAAAVLLVAEQANSVLLDARHLGSLSRSAEHALLDPVPAPPAECRAFYVVNVTPRPFNPAHPPVIATFYAPNVDAMMLASQWRVPTANGVSTWFPPGWPLMGVDHVQYLPAMRGWLVRNGIEQGACVLDLAARRWDLDRP